MSKKEKTNPLINFRRQEIDLVKFNEQTDKEQKEQIQKLLEDAYGDSLKIDRKYIMKVLRLTWNPKDDFTYLPYNLKVTKDKLNLSFEVVKKKPIPLGLLIFLIWLFCFALIGATYYGVKYVSLMGLNKDIDGDGIADINIDLDKDGKADINIDTNGDDKPELNIDYRHNLKSTFNIDTDNDGFADFNLVNDATENPKECRINCDTDGDGWPEINIDLDGDGVPDTNIDTDNDGIPDLNLDIDGDGKCDLMCDTDGDNKCDVSCIKPDDGVIYDDGNINPGKPNKDQTGNGDTDASTPTLMLNFVDGGKLEIDNLYPDDQPGMPPLYPTKVFYVENLSAVAIKYSLKIQVDANTFITSNLKYKLDGTNGGINTQYQTVPKGTSYIAQDVIIAPRVTHKYTMTFKLQGTGAAQNEDQGKTFQGKIDVEL